MTRPQSAQSSLPREADTRHDHWVGGAHHDAAFPRRQIPKGLLQVLPQRAPSQPPARILPRLLLITTS